MKHLLLISCSGRKHNLDNVKAIELYDGVVYRVIKKFDITNIDLYILSAKYGLLHSDDIISYYDKMMDKEKAREIRKETTNKLRKILDNKYDEIFVNLGKTYMMAIDTQIFNNQNVIHATGGIGTKMSQTKKWLEKIRINVPKNLDLSDFS